MGHQTVFGAARRPTSSSEARVTKNEMLLKVQGRFSGMVVPRGIIIT